MEQKKAKIISNFLDDQSFREIKNFLMSPRCPWRFIESVNKYDNSKNGYFLHNFKDCDPETFEDRFPVSNHFHLIFKILEKLKYKNILRIRSSLYPRRDRQDPDAFHVDYEFDHTVCIYYLNTNNGYTMFENGEKIPSKENQLAIFSGLEKHCSVVQTDTAARYIININILQ